MPTRFLAMFIDSTTLFDILDFHPEKYENIFRVVEMMATTLAKLIILTQSNVELEFPK